MILNRRLEIALLIFQKVYDSHVDCEEFSSHDLAKYCDESHHMTRNVLHTMVVEKLIKNQGSKTKPNYALGDRAHLVSFRDMFEIFTTAQPRKLLSKLDNNILYQSLIVRLDDKLLDCLIDI